MMKKSKKRKPRDETVKVSYPENLTDDQRIRRDLDKEKDMFTKSKVTIYDNQMLLVIPNKDCSERQLFINNGFKNPMKNLVTYLQQGDRMTYENLKDVHKPNKLGEFTKDNYGQKKVLGHQAND